MTNRPCGTWPSSSKFPDSFRKGADGRSLPGLLGPLPVCDDFGFAILATWPNQWSVTQPMGAVGSLIDGITNNPMVTYEMGPAPATIEFMLNNWMFKKVGWTPTPIPPTEAMTACGGGGVFTSGGSFANLTALLAARGKADPGLGRPVPQGPRHPGTRDLPLFDFGPRGFLVLASRQSRPLPQTWMVA